MRCPYGRGLPFSALYAGVYASRGYHVVFQSVRGTFGSGGEFNPMVNEIADGADTAEWLRDQPWFTGSFATIGLSYLGFTQWALLTDPPPEMKAAVITVGPHDFSAPRWGTGSFALNDFLGWSDLVAHQEDPGKLRAVVRQVRARRALARATSGLPVGEAGRALLGAGAPWWESWLEHPEHDDPFWSPLNIREALDRTEIPVLLFGGWQDLFLEQTLAQYDALKERGVHVAVTIGPWTHMHMMTKGAPTVIRESFDWLDAHLAGRGTHAARCESTSTATAGSTCRTGRPRCPNTCCICSRPAASAMRRRRTPRPRHGSPTTRPIRRPRSAAGCVARGRLPQRREARRTARCAVLHRRPAAGGSLRRRNTGDRAVALLRQPLQRPVRPGQRGGRQGPSRNVSDGYRCGTTDSRTTIRIELDATAHRFRAGSRIRVLIAGGSHPRFARNLGTGEPLISGAS